MYIPASHVKFLEAAGARVVPVSFRLRDTVLVKLLAQLNGIYIPGDNIENLESPKYMASVLTIMEYAQAQNVKSKHHFPVVAV
jgi:hypothetical protein